MNNIENQISRMKAMMNYGLQTEGKKKNSYSTIEYQREGADGKMYGIVREGAKFYIKVASKNNGNVVAESFDYIGGFRNRKDHEYTSYANALKQFELKMASVNESVGNKKIMVEAWNPEKKEQLAVEATEKMRREIMRQRQIMGNATIIQEKKNYTVDLSEACDKVDADCAATQKSNIKKSKDGKGEPTCNGGDPYTEKVDAEQKATQSTNGKKEFKPVMENEQVLGWNDNADYLDTTHGTEIGDTAPYTEGEGTKKEVDNGVVEEGVAMHNTDNQNSPEVGTNEVGDDAPFTKTVTEACEDDEFEMEEPFGDEEVMDDEFDTEEPMGDEFNVDAEVATDEVADDELVDDDASIESRLASIEEMMNKIADALNVDKYDDEPLYDDAKGEGSAEFDAEEPMGDELEGETEFEVEPSDDEEVTEEEYNVFESASYRRMMEDKMDYFGKHPAYQKSPIDLPSNKHQEYPGNYDMNDDSVQSEEPFGKEIGDSAPYEISPEAIENAITESIKRILKKKI